MKGDHQRSQWGVKCCRDLLAGGYAPGGESLQPQATFWLWWSIYSVLCHRCDLDCPWIPVCTTDGWPSSAPFVHTVINDSVAALSPALRRLNPPVASSSPRPPVPALAPVPSTTTAALGDPSPPSTPATTPQTPQSVGRVDRSSAAPAVQKRSEKKPPKLPATPTKLFPALTATHALEGVGFRAPKPQASMELVTTGIATDRPPRPDVALAARLYEEICLSMQLARSLSDTDAGQRPKTCKSAW